MHALIFAVSSSGTNNLPLALFPSSGRAVIDYLIDDVLLQKEISKITILTTKNSYPLIDKHIRNAFPESPVFVSQSTVGELLLQTKEDILFIPGDVHTSLKVHDFIRFYKQFKGITVAVYEGKGANNTVLIEKNKVIQYIDLSSKVKSKYICTPFVIIPEARLFVVSAFLSCDTAKYFPDFIPFALKQESVYAFNMGTGYCFGETIKKEEE